MAALRARAARIPRPDEEATQAGDGWGINPRAVAKYLRETAQSGGVEGTQSGLRSLLYRHAASPPSAREQRRSDRRCGSPKSTSRRHDGRGNRKGSPCGGVVLLCVGGVCNADGAKVERSSRTKEIPRNFRGVLVLAWRSENTKLKRPAFIPHSWKEVCALSHQRRANNHCETLSSHCQPNLSI